MEALLKMLQCVLKCVNTEAFVCSVSCSDEGTRTHKARVPDIPVQKTHVGKLSEKIVGEVQNAAHFSTYFCIY